MSSGIAQLAVAGAGAYAGSFVGQPALGWAIGSAIGGRLFAPDLPDIEGPRLEDLTVQASNYGAPLPKVYGTRIIAGQVIWKTDIKETKHEQDVDSGKGGGQSQTQISYTYSLSFAVGLCEGEIDGLSRVFADGKLIFDFSTDASFTEIHEIEKETRRGVLTVYRGTETQGADPVIESFEGSGNVPGFRGLAYIVFDDLQLADYGNRMPNITAEVVDNGSLALKTMVVENGLGAGVQASGRGYVWEGIPEILTDGLTYPNARVKSFDWDGNLIDDVQAGDGGAAAIQGASGINGIFQPVNATSVGGGLTACTLACVAYRQSLCGSNVYVAGAAQTGDCTDPGTNTSTFAVPTHPNDPTDKYVFSGFCVGAAGNDSYLFYSEVLGGFTNKRIIKYFAPGSSGVTYDCNVTNVVDHDIEKGIQTLDFIGQGNSCICFESDGVNVWYGTNGSGGTLQWFTWDQQGNFTLQNSWVGFGFAEPFGDQFGCLADNGVCMAVGSTSDDIFIATRIETVTDSPVNVADIVSDLCVRSGLTVGDIDVSSITDTVFGFSINRPSTSRRNLDILQKVAFFDIIESDWILEFKKRGTAPIRTISRDDMSADQNEPTLDTVINTTRTQEKDLPKLVKVQYLSKLRDQQVSEQSVRRIITDATDEVSERLPIVMTDDKARQIAEVLLHASWESRDRHEISVSLKHYDLEPGDVVTFIPENGDAKQARIVATAYQNGLYRISMVSELLDTYISEQEGEETTVREQVVPILGPAEGYILDLPVFQDAHNQNGVYTAGRGKLPNWPGGQIYQSLDDGVTFDPWSVLPDAAIIGSVIGVFPSALPDVWDRANTLDVKIKDPTLTLSSSTEAAVLNGANTAIVGVDGRWEVIGFVNATLTGTGEYTLDTFIRGRKGSTDYIDQHADNDIFILMDATKSDRVYVPISEYLVNRTYRSVTIGRLVSTATNFNKQYFAESYKCYRVGDLRAVKKSDGSLDVSWKHAVRYSGEWLDLVDVPDDETSLQFDVSVYDNVSDELVAFGSTSAESYSFDTILGGGASVFQVPDQGGGAINTTGSSNEYFVNPDSGIDNGFIRLETISTGLAVSSTQYRTSTAFDGDTYHVVVGNVIYAKYQADIGGESNITGLDLDVTTDLNLFGTSGVTYATASSNLNVMGRSDSWLWADEKVFLDEFYKFNKDLTINTTYSLPTSVEGVGFDLIQGNATHVFCVANKFEVYIFNISLGTFAGPFTWTTDNEVGIHRIEAFSGGCVLTTWAATGGATDAGFRIISNTGTNIRTQLEDGANYPSLSPFGNFTRHQYRLYDNGTKMLVPWVNTTTGSFFYEITDTATGSVLGLIPRDGWTEVEEIQGQSVTVTYGLLGFGGAVGVAGVNEFLTWSRQRSYSIISGNTVQFISSVNSYRTGGDVDLPELRVEVHQVSSTDPIGRGSVNSVIVPE